MLLARDDGLGDEAEDQTYDDRPHPAHGCLLVRIDASITLSVGRTVPHRMSSASTWGRARAWGRARGSTSAVPCRRAARVVSAGEERPGLVAGQGAAYGGGVWAGVPTVVPEAGPEKLSGAGGW
ncbi:hypothetical protein GCM10010499_45910 [Streptomyces thermoviolaceus subsp. apingens]|nr:hypothetical protein GCM10010499_45910 [Streptomyces thermoviolaceus subsp. apingens]